jgi:aconitate hydratase
MSPPLVVAYAIAGRMDWDPYNEPIGTDSEGRSVVLRDIWPTQEEIQETIRTALQSEMYRKSYGEVFAGDQRWRSLAAPGGDRFEWADSSTYVRHAPYFEDMPREAPDHVDEIRGARVIAVLGDSVTTDHISPAGSIKKDSPAGKYLIEHGVEPKDFNSYGSRRGNHEVMIRGTFANVRIRNQLVSGVEGGFTKYLPNDEVMTIYDAAMKYREDGTPLVILAGKEYGSGSSRDWAAKGPYLQGTRAVIAESYERIHRSNLIGMGILPLQFPPGETAQTLGLNGSEMFEIEGLTDAFASGFKDGREATVRAIRETGASFEFPAVIRIDTPQEALYYRHGGILQYVLRQLLGSKEKAEPISDELPPGVEKRPPDDRKKVTEAAMESFPASDAPSF